MTFLDFELEYLAAQPLGRLATMRPDGTLQASPVGFSYNAELGTIDIGGYHNARSHKYRNVADNGRVAFVVDDIRSTNPWRVRCLEIRGTAAVVPEQELIRITPTRVISFGIDDADSEPHEMKAHSRNVP